MRDILAVSILLVAVMDRQVMARRREDVDSEFRPAARALPWDTQKREWLYRPNVRRAIFPRLRLSDSESNCCNENKVPRLLLIAVELSKLDEAKYRDVSIDNRKLQEPLYVEEPSWIEVNEDYVSENAPERLDPEDPFFVTRGKKKLIRVSKRSRRETRGSSEKESRSSRENFRNFARLLEEDPFFVSRGKRIFARQRRSKRSIDEADRDFGRYLNMEDPFYITRGKRREASKEKRSLATIERQTSRPDLQKKVDSHVQDRRDQSKISSKMEFLNEKIDTDDPFFISRGKKTPIEEITWSENLSRYILKNVLENRRNPEFDGFTRTMRGGNLADILNEPFFVSRGKKSKNRDEEPFRDRRGNLEEILAKYDPFYVARGKRPRIDEE